MVIGVDLHGRVRRTMLVAQDLSGAVENRVVVGRVGVRCQLQVDRGLGGDLLYGYHQPGTTPVE